jgi:hypothetical protein
MPIALAVDRPAVTIFHGYDVSRLLQDPRWVERYRSVAEAGMQALCISEAGRRRLLDIGWPDTQIQVVHLGVDMTRFTFTPPERRWRVEGPHRILMVARLVPKKGVHVALEAMRRLEARGVDVELSVIGDGPERQRLEGLIAASRTSRVQLLGALGHDRTRQEFSRADIYIQPSVTAESGDQEGIPVSLMEAQASGLPVVSTRHSGIPELVLDGLTGCLTEEGDADGLAAAISSLLADRGRAQRFAEAGRARIEEEFNLDRQSFRFASYFEALAVDPTRRPSAYLVGRCPPRRKGLVIRSIPVGLLARKLLLLAHRHPDVRWDVLTTRSSAHAVGRIPLVGNVRVYEDGRLAFRHLGIDMLARLQDARYDLAVVPYGDESGDGFANVRRVARATGARRQIALTLRDTEHALPPARRRLRLTRAGVPATSAP